MAAPVLTVGSGHLDDLDSLRGEVAGETGAPGTGALDADGAHGAEATEPPVQGPVAGGCRRERFGAQDPAELVKRSSDVGVFVGIDAAGDAALWI